MRYWIHAFVAGLILATVGVTVGLAQGKFKPISP